MRFHVLWIVSCTIEDFQMFSDGENIPQKKIYQSRSYIFRNRNFAWALFPAVYDKLEYCLMQLFFWCVPGHYKWVLRFAKSGWNRCFLRKIGRFLAKTNEQTEEFFHTLKFTDNAFLPEFIRITSCFLRWVLARVFYSKRFKILAPENAAKIFLSFQNRFESTYTTSRLAKVPRTSLERIVVFEYLLFGHLGQKSSNWCLSCQFCDVTSATNFLFKRSYIKPHGT